MKRTNRYGFCVYCGQPTRSQKLPSAPVTCASHRDIPARDPHYMEPDQWKKAR